MRHNVDLDGKVMLIKESFCFNSKDIKAIMHWSDEQAGALTDHNIDTEYPIDEQRLTDIYNLARLADDEFDRLPTYFDGMEEINGKSVYELLCEKNIDVEAVKASINNKLHSLGYKKKKWWQLF